MSVGKNNIGGLCDSLYTPEERIALLERAIKSLQGDLNLISQRLENLIKILSSQATADNA